MLQLIMFLEMITIVFFLIFVLVVFHLNLKTFFLLDGTLSENIAFEVEKQAIKLGQFGHGYTYSGHPVSSAVALKTLEIMEKRNPILDTVVY